VSEMPVDVLAGLVPDPAREWAYRRALCREAYDRGWSDAWEAGRRELLEELARDQRWACPPRGVVESPAHAELEVRRWGAGGRAGFGDRRPGDYGGGPVTGW
jgi:hypothetical protein